MKFRKKPVVIDAVRWDGLEETIMEVMKLPRKDRALALRSEQDCLFIPTLEGLMRAEAGDWIICGVKGELYPCKPDIFEATYEPFKEEVEGICGLCGKPMPEGEKMFKFHGYSGNCPA